jgi:hypothetical protein
LIYTGQDHNHKEKKAIPNDKETNYLVNKYKWKLEQTKNHWSSLYSMQQYVTTVIRPFILSQITEHALPLNSHALLIIDCWSVHKSKQFLEWMKVNYPNYHIIFVPAGCTSVAQPADVILQRPLKHEYKNQYTSWTVQQMVESIKSGTNPVDCQLLKDCRTLKPLTVKWAVAAWLKLKEKKKEIAAGWQRIGWNNVLSPQCQIQAITTLKEVKEEDVTVEDDDQQQEEEEDEEEAEEEEIEDNEEDEGIELVLARCMKNAESVSNRRKSSRISTYSDANLARLLQEQAIDEAVVLD